MGGQGAFGVRAPGAARLILLLFGLLLFEFYSCCLLLLVTGFPAVVNLGQEFAEILYFLFTPKVQAGFDGFNDFGQRDFS